MMLQLIAALVGTIGFAILFGTPSGQCLPCGIIGLLGWAMFLVLERFSILSTPIAIFCATVLVVILSRIAARIRRCPSTVFMICGLFPLIPGGSIYWCTYYLIMNEMDHASQYGFLAAKIVFAIVIGIVVVMDIPEKVFGIFKLGTDATRKKK